MSHRRAVTPVIIVLSMLIFAPAPAARAQRIVPVHDTLQLADLQRQAVANDPRARQADLLATQSDLRQRDITAARLPTIGVGAQAQYQSDVVTIPFELPNGASAPALSRDSYDAYLTAQQPLYDPRTGARHNVERAQLAASQSAVRTSLFALRQAVNDAYFAALLRQEQIAEQRAAITALEAQRAVAESRVTQGTALPSEAETLQAEILQRRQAVAELVAGRDAALVVLNDLTGRVITTADALAVPDASASVAEVRASLDTLRARPEYQQFALGRAVLDQQEASVAATDLPRVSAFGRAGDGRPGLNPFARDFGGYWLAGVRVDWTPWNWGTTRREQQVLSLQKQIVAADEAAFRKGVQRSVARDLAGIDQLQSTLAEDDTIVALRERILRETGFRFAEGVITATEYVSRETDASNARIARATHRVQLAQARANFLTSIGLEVR
jgi:outer membrane protein TolC